MDVRVRIERELEELDREGRAAEAARRPVELDQQSVGRLSRMDALQVQAMAQGQQRRREVRERALRAALARLAEGEWGYCTSCGEPIEERRLEIDPAVPLCLPCARG